MPRRADGHAPVPAEIWAHVSRFLTIRQQCMLASTCRALRMLHLPRVTLLQEEQRSAQALAWAAPRWTHATHLQLRIWDGLLRQLSEALACSHPDGLSHLSELYVEVEKDNKHVSACMVACSWLLTQARNIQVLSAEVVRLDSFGAARGIKHLMLDLLEVNCDRLSASLSVLEQLQTLCISMAMMPEPQSAGALDLAALQALRSVLLRDCVPESIKLGDGCELHVMLEHSGRNAEHPVWDTVLPHLRSVLLDDSSYAVSALPSILSRACNLVKASLSIGQVGKAYMPVMLDGALARVEELVVHGIDLHAVVPASVGWQNVTLTARNALDLRFEAVLAFAEAIPAFCFRYYSLQVCCLLPSCVLFMVGRFQLRSQSSSGFVRGWLFWN